jgi:hypothetical protein
MSKHSGGKTGPLPARPCCICGCMTVARFAGEPMCNECADVKIHELSRQPDLGVGTNRIPCRECGDVTKLRFSGRPLCIDCIASKVSKEHKPRPRYVLKGLACFGVFTLLGIVFVVARDLVGIPDVHWTAAMYYAAVGAAGSLLMKDVWSMRL